MNLEDFKNISESTKRRNPSLFGRAVGRLPNPKHQHAALETLERKTPRGDQGASGLGTGCPIIRVQIISVRSNFTDSDNIGAGAKWLRDAISASLGLDDGDPRLDWEVSQIRSRGRQGVIVRIEQC